MIKLCKRHFILHSFAHSLALHTATTHTHSDTQTIYDNAYYIWTTHSHSTPLRQTHCARSSFAPEIKFVNLRLELTFSSFYYLFCLPSDDDGVALALRPQFPSIRHHFFLFFFFFGVVHCYSAHTLRNHLNILFVTLSRRCPCTARRQFIIIAPDGASVSTDTPIGSLCGSSIMYFEQKK